MEKNKLEELGIRRADAFTNRQSESFVKIYANNVQMGVSNWDMHLFFGEIVGEQEGRPIVEQKVKINMTKEFVKALANLLTTNIAVYEARYGPIRIDILPDTVSDEAVGDSKLAEKDDKKGSKSKQKNR